MAIVFSPARDVAMKPYKQLTYEQRCQIYVLKNSDMSQQAIANRVGVTPITGRPS